MGKHRNKMVKNSPLERIYLSNGNLGNVWKLKIGLDFKSLIRENRQGCGRKWEIVEYSGNKRWGLETEPFAKAIHIFRQINNAFPE